MANSLLLVKSIVGGAEAFFKADEINGYHMVRDLPQPSIPVLSSWLKNKGFRVGIFDLDRGGVAGLLKAAFDYDAVGFYLSFSSHFPVQEATQRLKETLPGKTVIVGGPSLGNLREDFYRLAKAKKTGGRFADYVDFLVYGEGEIALETILRHEGNADEIGAMVDREDPAADGIYCRDSSGKLHLSKKPAVLEDLSLLPIPDFEINEGLIPVAYIETSRGCAYRCPFCEMPAMYETRRTKERDQIEKEINRAYELGFRHMVVTDPSIYPTSRMEMLSELFAGKGIEWTGYARPGTWKGLRPYYAEETLRQAHESGCVSLFFGGESANEGTQKMYGKPHLDVMRETEAMCKRVGIHSCWSFMLLNPNETVADIDRLIELLVEMEPGMVVFGPFSLLPNSRMDQFPERYNLKLKDPDYKLKAPDVYARFANSAGMDKREQVDRLLKKAPWLLRLILKFKLADANYFRCTKTGLDFADGVFQMIRLDAALRERTNIEVGKSNYEMMYESAVRHKTAGS
ncbi:Hopanoid C-2 methylase [Pontiella desulfatans]|uniref:Hopanoid C-2 methylase n=1 Tax=Pontiella desulfatans TaxID=2750659 RepID=A0A6C2UAV1_PONDE|nr:radical SAM protein [Pontiella desulfatans]VGO16797.1 Hopanoid C-2 methylase [Pontiella desulfatans]